LSQGRETEILRPTLGARLTARFVTIAATSIAVVGVAAVLLTHFALDRADTSLAHDRADALHSMLRRELSEGDSLDEAITEVRAAAHAEGVRLSITTRGTKVVGEAPASVPIGECVTDDDWRACSVGEDDYVVTAAVALDAHRATVRALAEGMFAIVLLAIAALVVSVRRALREPLAEVGALVAWTKRAEGQKRPTSNTKELAELGAAFEELVGKLLAAAASERATSAHIAHELRTPLTALLAEMDTSKSDEGGVRLSSSAREEVVRMSDVIEAILVVSDRNSKRSTAIVNVADVARGLAPKGVIVEAPDEALTMGDERLVTLALKNLVQNADKHAGGARTLRVERGQDAIRVSVIDAGPGLEREGRDRMFDRYWRGVADGTGKGLGLALVRAVAELHGGVADARQVSAHGLDVGFSLAGVRGWNETAREELSSPSTNDNN